MASPSRDPLLRILELALAAPVPDRAELLQRECKGNAGLRAEVESLLRAHDAAGGFLADPTGSGSPSAGSVACESPGAQIDRYKLLERIGEGGMGTIWMAEQREPVKRRVALKIIKLGMDTKQVIARFEAERQALALMDHPHIAKVLDAGATETGRPYFVMEYIKGVPILEYCDREKLDTRARLGLFTSVCHAIQHAHQKGIIHRDIKPSNVLVTLHDGVPVPKVIDFGIAKATSHELTAKTLFTEHRQMIGTPAYMSPEQAEMSALDVDTRSDVYSLGVLLYELLTGTTPFDAKKLLESGYAEMLRAIREDEPHRPSTRISSLGDTGTRTAQQRRVELRKLSLLLRGDLDWIVMKCLEKDRTRRYETANGLAADIRRHLRDEPVTAGAPSAGYRLRKFVRRNRGPVLAGGDVSAALVLGFVGTGLSLRRALRAEDDARAQLDETKKAQAAEKARADELKQVSDFQQSMLAQVDPATAGARLTEDVHRRFAAALAKAGVPEVERSELASGFRAQWARVNATDAAAALIDETILKPAVKAIDEQFRDQPLVDAALRQVLAARYQDLGLYAAAEPLQASALETRRRILGPDHPDTLLSLDFTAFLLRGQGRLDEAERCYREALERIRRTRGEEHPQTIFSIHNLGLILDQQGKAAEAEAYFKDAWERGRRVLGEDHPDVLIFMSSRGLALRRAGRWTEAGLLYREAVNEMRRVLGDEHPSTLMAICSLGSVLHHLGEYAESERHHREALVKRRRVLGDEHPETLDSMQGLAHVLHRLDRFAQAEPYLRELLERRRRVLGDAHPDTLTAMRSLASLLAEQGRVDEAEPYVHEALEKSRRVLGADHPTTLFAINVMGSFLWARGKPEQAEPYLREALERRRRVLGEEDPDTLVFVLDLGAVFLEQGRIDEAEPLFREAQEKLRRLFGEEHPSTLAAVEGKGALLWRQGELDQAERCFRDVLEKRRRVLGEEHPETVANVEQLGGLLMARGELAEADTLYAEALEAWQRAARDPHPLTARMLHHHAEVLSALGRLDEALDEARRAHESYRAHPDWPADEAAHAAAVLAGILGSQGRLEEAIGPQRELLALRRTVIEPGSVELAGVLAEFGMLLVESGTLPAAREVEPLLRECFQIRLETIPDDWRVANTRSLLGGAILRIAELDSSLTPAARADRLREAETLLLGGYRGMKEFEASIPPEGRPRIPEALERLVRLAEARGDAPGGRSMAQGARGRASAVVPSRQGRSRPMSDAPAGARVSVRAPVRSRASSRSRAPDRRPDRP